MTLRRAVPFLPAVTFLATFGFFALDKNREARTVFKSGRGLLTSAAIVGGYLAIGFVLRRYARWSLAAPLVLAAIVLGLAAWIVRPYYVDETANRELLTSPVRDAAPDDGAAPETVPAEAARGTTEAVRISRGTIEGLGHDGRGTISLIRDADGALVVRFEDFDIEGVPDPQVYLVKGEGAEKPGEGVGLGRLKGNRGQVLDYAVPAGTDAGPGWTVLVWCRAFAVPVAHATQAAA